MNQPRYYAGEFDGERPIPVRLIAIGILLATITHTAAFQIGDAWGRAAERDAQAASAVPKAKPSPVARADWSQFDCRELMNICRNRIGKKLIEANR